MKAILLTAAAAASLIAGVAVAQQAPAPAAPQPPRAERQITLEQFQARQARRSERMFARLDANKDGAITKAEFDASAKARFRAADANQDGVLSGDELKRGREHGKGPRGHRMHRQPA
jgi:Ca2+-binding EF-hand superfamily protein